MLTYPHALCTLLHWQIILHSAHMGIWLWSFLSRGSSCSGYMTISFRFQRFTPFSLRASFV